MNLFGVGEVVFDFFAEPFSLADENYGKPDEQAKIEDYEKQPDKRCGVCNGLSQLFQTGQMGIPGHSDRDEVCQTENQQRDEGPEGFLVHGVFRSEQGDDGIGKEQSLYRRDECNGKRKYLDGWIVILDNLVIKYQRVTCRSDKIQGNQPFLGELVLAVVNLVSDPDE